MIKKNSLSVPERIDAALKLVRSDNPRGRITVSELSRLAGVSRANLYASYPDVLASLRAEPDASRPRRRTGDAPEKLKQVRMNLQEEVRKNRALVYLVVELRAELQRVRSQLAGEESAKAAQQQQSCKPDL